MSIIRDHMLVGGGLNFAHKAAAAAVFELAQDGYLTMRLSTSRLMGVRLTRTAKPANDLFPEQKVLLRVIFGADAKKGARANLSLPHQVPVAITLAAYARALLVADGSIRKLQPRWVYRVLSVLFYSTVVVAALIVGGITKQVAAFVMALVFATIAWAFFGGFTHSLKRARVFRTRKSKSRYEMLNGLRANSRFNTHRASITVAADQLSHELLWLRYGEPRSVTTGLYDQKPEWCDGDGWFVTRPQIAQAFVVTMEALARSLGGQDSITTHIYALHAEDPPSDVDLAESKLNVITDLDGTMRDVVELSNDVGDWGGDAGGDGSGGDGGDGSGGDGGDGGGDG